MSGSDTCLEDSFLSMWQSVVCAWLIQFSSVRLAGWWDCDSLLLLRREVVFSYVVGSGRSGSALCLEDSFLSMWWSVVYAWLIHFSSVRLTGRDGDSLRLLRMDV